MLKIYWSRFFLYGGGTLPFQLTLHQLFQRAPGLGSFTFERFCLRFEWVDKYVFPASMPEYPLIADRGEKFLLKKVNKFLAYTISINHKLANLNDLNILRNLLVRSYRGRAYVIGKPSHGQRTRSNANSAAVHNSALRPYMKAYRQHLQLQLKSLKKVDFYRDPKAKTRKPRIRTRRAPSTPLTSPKIYHWF